MSETNEKIRKLKSKDARMTALAHIDSRVGCDEAMLECLKLTDKMTPLKNAAAKWYSDLLPENRPQLTALESKLYLMEQQLLQIARIAEELGLDAKKFLKNRRDYFANQQELRKLVAGIDETLGSAWSVNEDAPYLEGFLNR